MDGSSAQSKSPPISCLQESTEATAVQTVQGTPVSGALMSSGFSVPLVFFSLVSPDGHLSVVGLVCLHCTCGEPGAGQYFHVSRVKGEEHYTCTLIYASEAANRVKCDLSTALLHDSSARCSVTLSDINPHQARESSSRASRKSWAGRLSLVTHEIIMVFVMFVSKPESHHH